MWYNLIRISVSLQRKKKGSQRGGEGFILLRPSDHSWGCSFSEDVFPSYRSRRLISGERASHTGVLSGDGIFPPLILFCLFFLFCFGPWDWKTQWGGPGQRAQCCRLCPSHWQQEACGWPPRALIYDTALQRPGGVSVSDGDPGLLQNGTRRGVFTVPTLLRQRGKFHCLTGQFTAMGLSPCFSSLCFFCLLIKCEVTKQLNSSVVFRQEVEKGYPGGKANMIDRGWLEIYIGNNSFLKTFFISWWEVWGKSSTRRMDD